MKTFKRIAVAAVAVASMLAALQPAVAAGRVAAAELKQVHIDLIDLDPTDGIAPSIRFNEGYFVDVTGFISPANSPESFIIDRSPVGSAFSKTTSTLVPSALMRLEASAGDPFSGVGPTLSAFGDAGADGSVWAKTMLGGVFTLSPHTRVVVTGQPGDMAATVIANTANMAWAQTSVGFCPLTSTGESNCYDVATQVDLSDAQAAFEYRDQSNSVSYHPALLSMTWDNINSTEQSHYLYAHAVVLSAPFAAPVPEPTTAMMLAMGLGFAGWKLRKRRGSVPAV